MRREFFVMKEEKNVMKKKINSKSVYARTTGFTAIGKVTERLIEPL